MKTLIFNGSPRMNGDTNSLIKKITSKKIDEYNILNAYKCIFCPALITDIAGKIMAAR